MLTNFKKFWAFPNKLDLLWLLIKSFPYLLPTLLRGEDVEIIVKVNEKGGENNEIQNL